MGVLGVPNTRPGWLRPAALNQARARRSFSLLVNRPSGPLPRENFLKRFSRARRARRTGWPPHMQKRRATRALSQARRIDCPSLAGHLVDPDTLPVRRSAALRPCRATAASGSRRTRGDRQTNSLTRCRRPSAGARRCKRGHPSGALILKPCKFAVKLVCNRRTTADRTVA
jgi:hypothetical protein